MGGVAKLLGMMPGASKQMNKIDADKGEEELKRFESIIYSMTPDEKMFTSLYAELAEKRTELENLNLSEKELAEKQELCWPARTTPPRVLSSLFTPMAPSPPAPTPAAVRDPRGQAGGRPQTPHSRSTPGPRSTPAE